MKVIALTLCLAALTAAQFNNDLQLKCTQEEIGIRWPSYYSNSDYYVCQRIGGRQIKLSCEPGEVFTFALQICTTPNRFIPPPPLEILPTTAPMGIQPLPEEQHKPHYPRPIHPTDNMHPPIIEIPIGVPQQPIPETPIVPQHPPVITDNEIPEVPVNIPEEEITGPPSKPVMPPLPGKPKPQVPSKKPAEPAVPLPPTPAPTPPVVPAGQPTKKPAAKKPPSAPSAAKKQPPVPQGSSSKKQPPKPAGKKTGPPKPPSKV